MSISSHKLHRATAALILGTAGLAGPAMSDVAAAAPVGTSASTLKAQAPSLTIATASGACATTRFAACNAAPQQHFDVTDTGGVVRGSFDFVLSGTMTTAATNGDITVLATYVVSNQTGETLTDTFTASGCQGPCAPKNTTTQSVTFTNGTHTVKLVYTAEQVAVGQAAVVTPQFSYTMKTKYASYAATGPVPGDVFPRCDRALPGNNNTAGCVFTSATPTWAVTSAYPAYKSHVHRAIASGLPSTLTRADSATVTANRNRACGTNVRPTPTNFECDEYPMASTNQGAASGGTVRTFDGCQMDALPKNVTGATGWSQCYIPANENQSAGIDLSSFYRNQRILVNDKFTVSA